MIIKTIVSGGSIATYHMIKFLDMYISVLVGHLATGLISVKKLSKLVAKHMGKLYPCLTNEF